MVKFFDKVKAGAENMGKAVKEKADEVSAIAKINKETNEQKQKIHTLKLAIGEAVYAAFGAGEDVAANKENCEAIKTAQARLDELAVELLRAKGIKKCVKCGKEMELGVKFCPACGAQQPEEPKEEKTEEKPEEKTEEKTEEK